MSLLAGRSAGLALIVLGVCLSARAALTGDVPDVKYNGLSVGPLTVVVERTGAMFIYNPSLPNDNPIQLAIQDAGMLDGDRLLLGPGRYVVPASYDGFAVRSGGDMVARPPLPCVSLAGCGSGTDANSNTVLLLAGGSSRGIRLETSGATIRVGDLRIEGAGGASIFLANDYAAAYELVNVAMTDFGAIDAATMLAQTDGDDTLTISNCLFSGGSGACIALGRDPLSPTGDDGQAHNWVIRECEFRDAYRGIALTANSVRVKILGNVFERITGGATAGAAAVEIRPEASVSPDTGADTILIQGNQFRDIGRDTGTDNTINCGIVLTAAPGATISRVHIRENSFEDTPAAPVMQAAVRLEKSGGEIRYVVDADNSYASLAWHIVGTSDGGLNLVYPMELLADRRRIWGVQLAGDSNGDGRIDAADVDNNTQDIDGSGAVDAADRMALIQDVLGTTPGDFDLNWKVDGADFLTWQKNFPRLSGARLADGDADGDGAIKGTDFLAWSAQFGRPEPFFAWGRPTAPTDFWQNTVEEVAACTRRVQRGTVEVIANSPGARPVYAIRYGAANLERHANYNSAVGGGDISYYAHKPVGTPPAVMVLGPVHGAEFETVVGAINLVSVIETGYDLRGTAWPDLKANADRCRVIIVPLSNPDGRARCVPDTWVGRTGAESEHWTCGVRANGTDWTWPQVKLYHPATYDMAFLGCYFNDAGINIMHDNWAAPWAAETRAILKIADQEAPDYVPCLHSHGGNAELYLTAFTPRFTKIKTVAIGNRVATRLAAAGLSFGHPTSADANAIDGTSSPGPTFNLPSMIAQVCGGTVYTYEASRGCIDQQPRTKAQILDTELMHFDELFKYAVANPVVWD